MKSFFKSKQGPQPFLAPLGSRPRLPRLSLETLSRLPPSAAPIAVTLVGGLALIVVLGALLSRETSPSRQEPAQLAAEQVAPEQPAAQSEELAINLPETAAAAETGAPDETDQPGTSSQEASVQPAPPLVETASQLLQPETLAQERAFDPDLGRTSSIPPARSGVSGFVPSVPVAETEDEIAELEEIQRREVENDVGAPSEEETASVGPVDTPALQQATTTRYVNMRAGPSDDAEIVLVVPALMEVEAEAGCNWCTVSYDGRTGYIYKTFLSYE